MSEIELQEPSTAAVAAVDDDVIYYHRLARRWAPGRRWRPVWGVLLSLAIYAAFLIAVLGIVAAWTGPRFDAVAGGDDMTDPTSYLVGLGAVAAMLPAVMLGFWIVGCRPIGLLSSVAGRFRWSWLVRLLPAALVIWVAVLAISFLLEPVVPSWGGSGLDRWLLLLVVVLVTPWQAAAEEYVFRGASAQVVGAWLKHPFWAIVLPLPLFVAGHAYDWVGLTGVAVFGIAAGWLTYRTGGLEAAIVMHVVNNTILGVLSAWGLVDANATSFPPSALILDLMPILVFTGWVEWLLRRRRGAAVRG